MKVVQVVTRSSVAIGLFFAPAFAVAQTVDFLDVTSGNLECSGCELIFLGPPDTGTVSYEGCPDLGPPAGPVPAGTYRTYRVLVLYPRGHVPRAQIFDSPVVVVNPQSGVEPGTRLINLRPGAAPPNCPDVPGHPGGSYLIRGDVN
jgi:hypothetical protein